MILCQSIIQSQANDSSITRKRSVTIVDHRDPMTINDYKCPSEIKSNGCHAISQSISDTEIDSMDAGCDIYSLVTPYSPTSATVSFETRNIGNDEKTVQPNDSIRISAFTGSTASVQQISSKSLQKSAPWLNFTVFSLRIWTMLPQLK